MKIFIKDYSVQQTAALIKQRLLKTYHIRSFNFTRILSEEGFFIVTPNKLIQHIHESDCHVLLNHPQWTLWLDKSETRPRVAYQVPFNHTTLEVICHYYSVNKKNNPLIQLVVEETRDTNTNSYTVTDFYFETNRNLTESEIIDNADLNVFLSLLN
jgi:hypothetical protein